MKSRALGIAMGAAVVGLVCGLMLGLSKGRAEARGSAGLASVAVSMATENMDDACYAWYKRGWEQRDETPSVPMMSRARFGEFVKD